MILSSLLVQALAGKRVFLSWGSTLEICRPPEVRGNRETFWAALVILNLVQQSGGEWMLANYPDRVVIGTRAGMRLGMDVLETHLIQWDGFGTLQDWAKGGAL